MTYLPQILIIALGVTAAHLVASGTPRARFWGGIVGLCAQPFWAWTFVEHEQWPMLVLILLYGSAHVRAIRNNRNG